MIARNYIKHPEALRFQCEMFSNGYKNSPRIMRLMTVLFDWTTTAPQWFIDIRNKAKALMKKLFKNQIPLDFDGSERIKNANENAKKQTHFVTLHPYIVNGDNMKCQGQYRVMCKKSKRFGRFVNVQSFTYAYEAA